MSPIVDGKVALVTGGGSGIGRGAALVFAREGVRGVVVADRDEEGGAETVKRLVADGNPFSSRPKANIRQRRWNSLL